MICPPEGFAEWFYVPGPGPYALTHSVGCLPKVAVAALDSGFIRPWAERGGEAWADWIQRIADYRSELAALFGGTAAEYCPQANLSSGLAKVLSALPQVQDPKRVLLAAEDSFPSLGFVLQQARRWGYELRLIPRAQDPAEPTTWSAALTGEVYAVLVTHVHSNTGALAPVSEIAKLCAERGILCIVDVAQSAGILPVSFPQLGAHIVLGSCVKWLCGGPGAGFMWVRGDLVKTLQPADVGWFSHADPFQFDIRAFEYAPDSRRFWGGTPSVAPYVVATAGLRLIRKVGVSAINAHNRRLLQAFIQEISPAWRKRLPSGERGGTLCIPARGDLNRVTESLNAAQVQFDRRGTVVRLSFHLYNGAEDAVRTARAWPEGA
jgi:kynureninase